MNFSYARDVYSGYSRDGFYMPFAERIQLMLRHGLMTVFDKPNPQGGAIELMLATPQVVMDKPLAVAAMMYQGGKLLAQVAYYSPDRFNPRHISESEFARQLEAAKVKLVPIMNDAMRSLLVADFICWCMREVQTCSTEELDLYKLCKSHMLALLHDGVPQTIDFIQEIFASAMCSDTDYGTVHFPYLRCYDIHALLYERGYARQLLDRADLAMISYFDRHLSTAEKAREAKAHLLATKHVPQLIGARTMKVLMAIRTGDRRLKGYRLTTLRALGSD